MLSQVSRVFFFVKYFSGDFIFLLALFILFFAYAMYFGRGRIVSLILAFYPATLIFMTFPFMTKAVILHGDKLILLNKIAIFLVFLVPITIVIDRYIFSESSGSGLVGILKSGGFAVTLIILVMIFSYSTLSFDLLHNFSPQIDSLFSTPARLFSWNLAPILLLACL